MKTEIKFLYQNEVNDVFSFTNENGDTDYISFPRTMGMSVEDVDNYLN